MSERQGHAHCVSPVTRKAYVKKLFVHIKKFTYITKFKPLIKAHNVVSLLYTSWLVMADNNIFRQLCYRHLLPFVRRKYAFVCLTHVVYPRRVKSRATHP